MAIKVDLEPGKGDQELLGGKGNKKDLLKHLPANVARGLALMGIAVSSGACLAPSAKTPTAEPPAATTAHTTSLELSATATVPEPTFTTEPTPTSTPTSTLTPTPEPTPTTEPTPTSTPEPTPTAKPTQTPEQALAEFKESAEYKQGLQDYLNAMGLKEEDVAITEEVKVINGQEYRFLVATPDQQKLTELQKKYSKLFISSPLFYFNHENQWKQTNLKYFADSLGIKIGSQFTWNVLSDSKLHDVFFDQVNSVTIDYGVYWNNVQPQRGKYDFSVMDKQIAEAKKMEVSNIRGHALVFANASWANPEWLTNNSYSKDELTEILTEHIKTVVTHGKQQGI